MSKRSANAINEKLIEEYQRTNDIAVRDRIVELSMPLVYHIASSYNREGMETEDIAQDGVFGLIYAIDHFDGGRGIPFSNYAGMVIRHRMTIRFRRKMLRTISIDSLRYHDGEVCSPVDIIDGSVDIAAEVISEMESYRLYSAIELLNDIHRNVLEKRYGLRGPAMTLEEIGRESGISRQRVEQIEIKALEELRKLF